MAARKPHTPAYQVRVTTASGRKVDLLDVKAENSATARRAARAKMREERDVTNLKFSARRQEGST